LTKLKVLVIDDEPEIGRLFSKILSEEGCEVFAAMNGNDGICKIKKRNPDLVILDLKLPQKSGIEVLREIRKFNEELKVVVLTAYETVESAVEAMKLGAHDYLSKPIKIQKIKNLIENTIIAKEKTKRITEKSKQKEDITEDQKIEGQSPQIKETFSLIKKVAPHDITVLLKGESGTGKELAAHAIHRMSRRAQKPFVVIDCAAMPDTLVESNIFGHEKGSFTGAYERKIGKFEQAQQGTIFLDEIGNLSSHIQVKLLRALQERTIERLGGRKPIPVDFRLIAATNVNLEKAKNENHFREDLYYRLHVFPIEIPPLRGRDGDVKFLSQHYLKKFNKTLSQNVEKISSEAMDMLIRYSWPGNVRELMHVIESAVILADHTILPENFPLKIQNAQEDDGKSHSTLKKAGRLAKEKVERRLIEKTLKDVNWNKSRAAEILNIDYKTLYNKIKDYSIYRN
jgi:DNA-binding NtrC family response regulator